MEVKPGKRIKVALKTLHMLAVMHLTCWTASFYLNFGACVYLVSQILKLGLGFFQPKSKFPGDHSQHNKSLKATLCRCAVCCLQKRINKHVCCVKKTLSQRRSPTSVKSQAVHRAAAAVTEQAALHLRRDFSGVQTSADGNAK